MTTTNVAPPTALAGALYLAQPMTAAADTSPSLCSDTLTPFTDDPCLSPATVVCWSDALGWQERRQLCGRHASLFERVITKHYPKCTAHVEPIASHPSQP